MSTKSYVNNGTEPDFICAANGDIFIGIEDSGNIPSK